MLRRAHPTARTGRADRAVLATLIRLLPEQRATQNNGRGPNMIHGELPMVGHRVSAAAIRRVLKALGIPERPSAWRWRAGSRCALTARWAPSCPAASWCAPSPPPHDQPRHQVAQSLSLPSTQR